jgi:response regulator RpfG family c-di-GMP phosphodiesterase
MNNHRPILLIVDDDPTGREAIRSVLMNQDMDLFFATNGLEALEMAGQLQPDLILLDVMMPELDGFEVCRRLRADPLLAEVPVVMVTTLDDRESRLEGIQAGADDFISKPIDRAELRVRVRTITRLNRYRLLINERAQLERQVQRLTALRTIGLAVSGCLDLQIILSMLLQQISEQLNVNACDILLYDPEQRTFTLQASRGFMHDNQQRTQLNLNNPQTDDALFKQSVITWAPQSEPAPTFLQLDLLHGEIFNEYCAVPLIANDQLVGLLEIFQRSTLDSDPNWMAFLQALCEQGAIAILNARLYGDLQHSNQIVTDAYDRTIEGWSRVLEFRDRETEGHSVRVTNMTIRMAEALGLDSEEQVHIRRGALLHDIGKLSIPDSILLKAGPLTDEEWGIMRKHPVYAYDLLLPIDYLRPALDIPHYHHERWDGTGYPCRLKGKDIPLPARMFAMIDVWDALSSDRPYRAAWSLEQVKEYLKAQSGTHFDPELITIFLDLLNKNA